MKKSLKILAGFLLSIVLLVVAAMMALVFLVNPNDYKPQLQALAAKQHVELVMEGDLSWSFYPRLGIQAGKFSVKPPMKQVSKPLQFDSLVISVKVLPLLHRQIVVDKVIVRGTEISLHDEASGNDTTIKNLVIESHDLNLGQHAFPLTLSLQASTTEPPRNVTLNVNTQVAVDAELQHIALNDLSIRVDNTTLNGDIQLSLGATPFVHVTLAGDAMDVDHYLASTGAEKAGNNDSKSPKLKSADDVLIPVDTLKALPGEYALSFKQLTLKHLQLANFNVQATISAEGVATIKQLKTSLYGGEFALKGTVDARTAQPAVQMALSLSPLQLEPALKDYLQKDKTFVSGDIAFNADINTQGSTQTQLLNTLNGNFSFASQSLTLNNVDLTSSLDTSLLQLLEVKLPKLMSGENQTVLSDMKGKGVIQQGIINNTSLTALGPCLQLSGNGSYRLSNADVNYHLGILFPSANTDKLCSDINNRLKDITWPLACKGSLDEGAAKICGVDKEAMNSTAGKSLKKEAGQKLEKKLDKELQKKFGGDADAVKKALNGLF